MRSAALALFSGARERIGFADSAAALTYTRRVPPTARRPRGRAAAGSARVRPSIGAAVTLGLDRRPITRQAEHWLASHGVEPGFVALAPGSIWATKRWPYYAELAAGARAAGR